MSPMLRQMRVSVLHQLRHEKAFRIATIDCSGTAFDSSHNGESSAGLSGSATEEGKSGNDRGFTCSYGEG